MFMRPSAVDSAEVGGKPIEPVIIAHICAFFAIFVLVFALGSFIMTFFTPNLETAATSVIATLENDNSGLNAVGATQNYAAIPVAGQAFSDLSDVARAVRTLHRIDSFLPSFWENSRGGAGATIQNHGCTRALLGGKRIDILNADG